MEKECIFTLTTQSHLFKSLALKESLNKFGYELDILNIDDLSDSLKTRFEVILKKYKNNSDKIRWALKPFYAKFLLNSGFEKVIYIDNDVFFFSTPKEIFDKLHIYSMLLSPHFYSSDPRKHQNWFEANYRVGLYNAGFFAVNQNSVNILSWWADCCEYNIKKSFWRGLFDDQKYLDLVPVIFDNVYIEKDTGYNLAGWNQENRLNKLGSANLDSVVFVHFAEITFQKFRSIDNPFHSLYVKYLKEIKKINPNFIEPPKRFTKRNILAYFYFLKWKLARKFD